MHNANNPPRGPSHVPSKKAVRTGRRSRWIGRLRQLWLGRVLVKQTVRSAPAMERILAAFEEEGWPELIYDPLPPVPGRRRQRRLRVAIENLNRRLDAPLIHFYTRWGDSIGWELVPRAKSRKRKSRRRGS